jgi:hypothetical protein
MKKKIIWIITIIFIIVVVSVFYYRYYFVFGEGVKAGQLNYFVKKGFIFKTNEGRLIQSGLKTVQGGNISTNEFMFSVTSQRLADTLAHNAGAFVQLHYKEYLHTLPWRGVSVFVADSAYSIMPANTGH